MKISAVIPTRNRVENLRRVLTSLLSQSRPVDEIIIVDSSDSKELLHALRNEFRSGNLVWLDAEASVCIQRNMGIRRASGDWILLSDDDIEFEPDYVERLEEHTLGCRACSVVAGRLLELNGHQWTDQYPVKTFGQLLWRFIFQTHIWGDLKSIRPAFLVKPLFNVILRFYRKRKNSFSAAGWPLITDWQPTFHTSFYSMGANMVRKEWLLRSPYDEVLDRSGIGDNYGVALGFPATYPIHVIDSTSAYHQRAKTNRTDPAIVYYRRILALHYFIKRNPKRFTIRTQIVFVWSLFGKTIFFLVRRKGRLFLKTLKAICLIVSGNNPYWIGFVNGQKIVEPH